jgi:hypothetical protein
VLFLRLSVLRKKDYALYYKLRNLAISIDLQLKLFDSLIAPILVYSCEIWGFENKQGIEKLHFNMYLIIPNKAQSNFIKN